MFSPMLPRTSNVYLHVATLMLLALVGAAQAGTLVQFRTPLGDLPVELYDEDKPATVRNFIRLVRAGAYTNTLLSRCVTNFVLQGGGYRTALRTSTNVITSLSVVPSYGPITNEFAVSRVISNTFGTLAMAKTNNNPDSATATWFFNLADNSANLNNQNGGFTVFGHLLGPTNLLDSFNRRSLNDGIINAGSSFPVLPVLYSGTNDPRYVDLIYVDITLLQVAVTNTPAGDRTISWLSTSNWTQVVEYTDGFPPFWQELFRTNGHGLRQETTDADPSPERFYRVRAETP